jgi:hypothetical protein
MTVTVQEQLPAWYFARYGKPPHKVDVDRAQDWVHKAMRQTRRPVEREFEGRGFQIRTADLSWPAGRVRMRARLNLRQKELVLDCHGEADLHQELEMLGFPLSPSPREVILAHELFHLFCPKCPADLAEMAAHLYAAEVLSLPYFPGLLDVAERFQRETASRWRTSA